MTNSTGYGCPASKRLYFDGDEDKYELWEIKFLAYLRLQKLHKVVQDGETSQADADDGEKNSEVFAQLVQFLDDKSLLLIIRDAKDDGKKAIKILRSYYLGNSKPRIIALYTELTSLKMVSTETVTDYMLRGETAATSLKSAGETISDSLLVAMILKGLPEEYKAFSTVTTQKKEDIVFSEFKSSLRSYEESEKCRSSSNKNDNVMNVKSNASNNKITCYSCGKQGHIKSQCKYSENKSDKPSYKSNRWCNICKNKSHDTYFCRKKNAIKTVGISKDNNDTSNDNFAFKVIVGINSSDSNESDISANSACKLLVDCGATAHIVNDISKFVRYDKTFDSSKHFIELADGSRSNGIVTARGDAHYNISDSNGKDRKVTLKNALCIPSYNQDIFSVQAATENGATFKFTKAATLLETPDGTEFNISKDNKLYYLNNVTNNVNTKRTLSLQEWHKIFGHCNVKDVLKLETVVEGMKISDKNNFYCKTCVEGKMCEYRSRKPDCRATQPLQLIHSDLAGPVSPVSREGSQYVISFVDDYSGAILVYFLKHKSDAVAATEKFLADVAPYGTVKRLRSDNGTEYTSSNFKSLMIKNKIKHEFSAPYSPHQNGTAERNWRSLFEMARCLLLEAKLPKILWNYAVRAAAYIRNRCYNPRTGKTPCEMLTSVKPNVKNMHVFGSKCYAYVQNKKKLDARCEGGVFIGYDPFSPAYLIYFSATNEVRRVRCVNFNDKQLEEDETLEDGTLEYINGKPSNQVNIEVKTPEVNNPVSQEQPVQEILCEEEKTLEEPAVEDNKERYPQRQRSKPKYLEDYQLDEKTDVTNCTIDYCYRMQDIPRSYEEAISSPEGDKWKSAMEDEISSLIDNETYDLTPLPIGHKVVGGKWVYAVKLDPSDKETFKARYVAKGYKQIENIDYKETFSPTARITSVRLLMQLAVESGNIVHQMDVKTAYLNANIDCELYVEQPKGFVETGSKGEKLVCKLNKSLYGLKQSGRMWNNVLHKFLLAQKFKQSLSDNCVYIKNENGSVVTIIVWVDDLLISAPNIDVINDVKHALCKRFKMKDLGQLSWFLGIEFNFNNECIKMSQTKYVEKILSRFGMTNCNPKATPCDLGINKPTDSNSKELADPKLYREIVGSLIYIMTCTRPDICYVVTKLSQKLAKPTIADLNLSKFTLKFLKGTKNYGLEFVKSNSVNLIGYSDSDWGGSEDRKSISGYCFKLNSNGPLISWRSKRQNTVALSSCEAEYIALTCAVQEANFLRQLLIDMLGNKSEPVSLYVDNQGAILLTKNPVYHQRTKHIDIRYHYIRSQIEHSTIVMHYVPSNDNVADMFTKPVNKTKLSRFNVCM